MELSDQTTATGKGIGNLRRLWFARSGTSSWHLRTYFALLLASFAVVAVAAFVYVVQQTNRDARKSAEHDARSAADTSAQQLGGSVALLSSTVAGLGGNPQIAQVMANPAACTLSFSWLTPGHLDLIRKDGTVVCTSRAATGRRGLYAGQRWLSRGLTGPVLIGPVRDPATGKQVVVAADSHSGRWSCGCLRRAAPARPQARLALRRRQAGRSGRRRQSLEKVVARSVDPARWIGTSLVDTAFDTPAGQGTVAHPDLTGTARLFAQSDVPGVGWRIYAGEDEAAALAAGKRLEHRQFAIILIGLTLTLLAALLIYRRVARPLARLAAAVRSASTQEGPATMPSSGPAEVRALAEEVTGLIGSLTASELSYHHLFDQHPAPLWLYDEQTLAFLAVNDAAIAMYGYSREEFLAMTIEEIRPREDIEALHLARADEGRRYVDAGIWRHRKKDGTVIEVEISSNAVEFAGHPARAVLARDVTVQRQLEEQLRQAQKMEAIGRLAGGVAHDFNNLLLVIRGYGATLLDDLTDEKLRYSALQIDSAAQRGAEFTHQLLAFSRQQVLHPTVINPNEVVDETVNLVRRMLREDIALEVELEPDIGPIVVDRGQLGQVMLNLLVNAREAMPQGGSLSVRTANVELGENYSTEHVGVVPGRYVLLQVTDTGAGMDEETRSRIFDPFFTTKEGGPASGSRAFRGSSSRAAATCGSTVSQGWGRTSRSISRLRNPRSWPCRRHRKQDRWRVTRRSSSSRTPSSSASSSPRRSSRTGTPYSQLRAGWTRSRSWRRTAITSTCCLPTS